MIQGNARAPPPSVEAHDPITEVHNASYTLRYVSHRRCMVYILPSNAAVDKAYDDTGLGAHYLPYDVVAHLSDALTRRMIWLLI